MDEYKLNYEEIPCKSDGAEENSPESNGFLGTLCLFYNASPFSDFAPYKFIIDGKYFPSVEHYVQLQMFQSFGLFQLVSKLHGIEDAVEFRKAVRQSLKYLSKSDIFSEKMFQDWRDKNTEKMLRKSNQAKYEQNLIVREHLFQTGERILIFTSKNDSVLGVGMSETEFFHWMSSENVSFEDLLNYFSDDRLRPRELGKNLLGLVLMEIRAHFNGTPSVISEWKQKMRKSCRNSQNTDQKINSEGVVQENEAADVVVCEDSINSKNDDVEASGSSKNLEIDSTVAKSKDRTVNVVKDNKIIFYHKTGVAPKIVSEFSEKQTDEIRTEAAKNSANDSVIAPASLEVKQSALERLKALRFEKPIVNPFTAFGSQLGNVSVASTSSSRVENVQKDPPHVPTITIQYVSRPVRKRCYAQPPIAITDMNDLEPGEIPSANYRPPVFRRLTDYPHITSLMDLPFPDDCKPELNPKSDEQKNSWKPSDNPLKELLQRAQHTLKKLEESGMEPVAPVVEGPVFPPFPTDANQSTDNRTKKSKKERKIGRQYKVRFTNDTAMLRHHANRWIRGGRLSTTGKFEEVIDECADDDDDDSETEERNEAEEARVIQMLEEAEETCNKKHYESQIVYEDTHQYEEYLKWYSQTHNEPRPGAFDNEQVARQRRWYQFYRAAVKFVDIPPDEENDTPSSSNANDNDVERSASSETNSYDEYVVAQQSYETLLQQWRWKQINQWKLDENKTGDDQSSVANQWTNGISYGCQPVLYKTEKEAVSNSS